MAGKAGVRVLAYSGQLCNALRYNSFKHLCKTHDRIPTAYQRNLSLSRQLTYATYTLKDEVPMAFDDGFSRYDNPYLTSGIAQVCSEYGASSEL